LFIFAHGELAEYPPADWCLAGDDASADPPVESVLADWPGSAGFPASRGLDDADAVEVFLRVSLEILRATGVPRPQMK
jgi:hypothetical protein